MQNNRTSEDDQWPIFGHSYKNNNSTRFWNRPTHIKGPFLIQNSFSRIGKKHQNIKNYFFSLTHDYTLHKSAVKMDVISKGSLNLLEANIVLRRTVFLNTSTQTSTDCLCLYKSDTLVYKLISRSDNDVDDLYDILMEKLVANNFEEQYKILDFLGKGAFASVYKVIRYKDKKTFAGKMYFRAGFESNKNKARFASMIKLECECL